MATWGQIGSIGIAAVWLVGYSLLLLAAVVLATRRTWVFGPAARSWRLSQRAGTSCWQAARNVRRLLPLTQRRPPPNLVQALMSELLSALHSEHEAAGTGGNVLADPQLQPLVERLVVELTRLRRD